MPEKGRDYAPVVAAAFGLGASKGGLVPVSYRSSQTWRLDTADASVLVKHVAAEEWLGDFVRAMTFERQALEAGVVMPRPLPPVNPTVGAAVEIDGIGLVRAYEWVDARPLADHDDVSEWLGRTLAQLHQLAPAATAQDRAPDWYRLDEPEIWQGWLAAGTAAERTWAPLLRLNMADVLDAASWTSRGFAAAGDYVMTHRDVEPWNVLIAPTGPVLIDWDVAGPDSASLEAAHSTLEFARRGRKEPGETLARRTIQAYVGHGGTPFGGPDVLVRRVGLRLGRLAERLRMSLGEETLGPRDLAATERRATEQIAEMPEFLARLRSVRF